MPFLLTWAPPALLCCASAVAIVLSLHASIRTGAPVAAVFPPWWSATDAAVAAGRAGRIVRFGALPFVVIVAAENSPAGSVSRQTRDLETQLHRSGALLVMDPLTVGGCSPRTHSL